MFMSRLGTQGMLSNETIKESGQISVTTVHVSRSVRVIQETQRHHLYWAAFRQTITAYTHFLDTVGCQRKGLVT